MLLPYKILDILLITIYNKYLHPTCIRFLVQPTLAWTPFNVFCRHWSWSYSEILKGTLPGHHFAAVFGGHNARQNGKVCSTLGPNPKMLKITMRTKYTQNRPIEAECSWIFTVSEPAKKMDNVLEETITDLGCPFRVVKILLQTARYTQCVSTRFLRDLLNR